MQEIAHHASETSLAAFCDMRQGLHEARLAAEHARQLQTLRDDFQRSHQNPAAPVRKQIQDEILTLRCPQPNCRQAFAAFDGCMAVQCSRAGCGTHFCAICMTACQSSADAHTHVRGCEYGNGSYHASVGVIPHLQNAARAAKLRALLQPMDRALVEGVLRSMEQDFADVGLQFDISQLA